MQRTVVWVAGQRGQCSPDCCLQGSGKPAGRLTESLPQGVSSSAHSALRAIHCCWGCVSYIKSVVACCWLFKTGRGSWHLCGGR